MPSTDAAEIGSHILASPYAKRQLHTQPNRRKTNGSSLKPHISVLVSRTDLVDDPEFHPPEHHPVNPTGYHLPQSIPPFEFESRKLVLPESIQGKIDIVRIPSSRVPTKILPVAATDAVSTTMEPPKDPSILKYWKQRRRLFSKFDLGIQLDQEGWFSVTPEQIADHVATETLENIRSKEPQPVVVLDAFGGCGGNSIAFAKRPDVGKVISVDIDRQRLKLAAQNASIYGIPKDKLIFVECNAVFILQFCYRAGAFVLDQPVQDGEHIMQMMAAMPPPVNSESCHGYTIGGIDELPRNIDLVFMDPPWGGVDYNCVFGKNGYSLQDNMRIRRLHPQQQQEQVADAFFDSFSPSNQHERKAAFNSGLDETNCVNGSELLAFAAAAAPYVVYDIPKNTNRSSLAQAALDAGYRGNCRLDEHYLNGRLKTVSAYFGVDWGELLGTDV